MTADIIRALAAADIRITICFTLISLVALHVIGQVLVALFQALRRSPVKPESEEDSL